MTTKEIKEARALVRRLMLNTPVITQEHMDAATEIMPMSADTLTAALDEIERLRGALEDVAGVGFDAPMTWAGTDAEWERRRANAMQHAASAALKGDNQ